MRKQLFKTTAITLAMITAALGMTACGNKTAKTTSNNTNASTETITVADKSNTTNKEKTSKVVFDYTDADGNTSKLEGNATVDDNGEATIEVVDSNGNKTVFTGKAVTDNGKLSVSDIKVKDAGTLVKTDGTEIKVTEDSKIEDATESTEETKADVEAVKEEAKEEIIVADNDSSSDSEEEPVVSVTEPQVSENVVSEATEEEAVEVPNEPADSEPTPTPVETPVVEDTTLDVPSTSSEPEYIAENNSNDGFTNTGNFYDNYMNDAHMVGDENLIDKDSDPSKPCPYTLNTPIEGTYTGVVDGVYGTYPVYIVYTLCSEDTTGGKAVEIVRDTCYDGQRRVNGNRVTAYISLPIGEYDCGAVRASYVSRY